MPLSFRHHGLFLCGIGQDDATLGGLLGLEILNDHAVAQRLDLHIIIPPWFDVVC